MEEHPRMRWIHSARLITARIPAARVYRDVPETARMRRLREIQRKFHRDFLERRRRRLGEQPPETGA
jgi:hypothetical protein